MINTRKLLSLALSGWLFFSMSAQATEEQPAPHHAAIADVTTLEKIDTQVGAGEEADIGKTASVHYTGWLYDANAEGHKGRKFDSSHDRGNPFSFLLGAGRVIKGWDQGVLGMKVGGKRTLIIPSSMAYGSQGAGRVIPPDSALVFEVELIGLE
ncbi:MAG: FKBP-type peptidyl-prolyl cis-trans isomerase [Burkholderiales bacterium]|nr:FKBP-type peptidyl-prolyl cis-trans isomerase [Burkholderiales bacterium]